MFFLIWSTALAEVDAIIHLDSDMITTGNIRKFWERFSLMRGEQFAAIGKGNEFYDRNYLHTYKRWFGGDFILILFIFFGLLTFSEIILKIISFQTFYVHLQKE